MSERISWDEYFMQIAELAAQRATCNRLQVGCVIVDRSNRIVSTGYNGSPKGMPHCIDIGCLMYDNHCKRCLHAEQNALLQAGHAANGSTIYITHFPCDICIKLILQAGIKRIVYRNKYDNPVTDFFVTTSGVKTEKLG